MARRQQQHEVRVTPEAAAILRGSERHRVKSSSAPVNGHPAPPGATPVSDEQKQASDPSGPADHAGPADQQDHADHARGSPGAESTQKKAKHFVRTSQGVYYVNEETESRMFICSPLSVVAYTRDTASEAWGRLLAWTDRGDRKHQWSMPMELLAGDGTQLRQTLLNGGVTIGIGQGPRQFLLQYIQSERPDQTAVCVPHIGWHGRTFVFPECAIPDDPKEKVIFQTAARGEHFYNRAGTLQDWRDFIGRPCCGNSRLTFAVSTAFAGPLLRPLNVEGGGFHLVGTSSSGKSTVQLVAGSVCGGQGSRGFARSWRATGNAFEGVAELHNDGLLILDEIREVPDPKEIDSLIYMLSNGSGKGRMGRNMTAQRTMHWQLLLLSSGEVKLSEFAGRQVKAGGEVRLLNIPADAGKGMGVFEDIHDSETPRAFSEELKATARTIYGEPLHAFLGHLVGNWDVLIGEAKTVMADFIDGTGLPPDAAAEVGRALRRVALVAAAGEMATTVGVTGWPPGEASRAAARCFQDWVKARGGVGQADLEAGIRQVRAFIEAHGSSRFQSTIVRHGRDGDRIEERIIDRAGYWREDEDGERQFLVFTEAFQNQLCRGFDHRAVAQELARRDLLVRGDGKNFTRKESLPNEGRPRVYVIRGRILDDEEENKIASTGA